MQLFVATPSGRTLTLEVNSVECLKTQIQDREGIPVADQRLQFGSKVLQSLPLVEYGIQSESTVELFLCLLGAGKKKRKKKTYTKPKVEKHKKKKVKLAVLKYYKVDENNKITRLRRECTNPNCGAATFMAIHYDRYTCGRCGYTLVYQEEGGAKKKKKSAGDKKDKDAKKDDKAAAKPAKAKKGK